MSEENQNDETTTREPSIELTDSVPEETVPDEPEDELEDGNTDGGAPPPVGSTADHPDGPGPDEAGEPIVASSDDYADAPLSGAVKDADDATLDAAWSTIAGILGEKFLDQRGKLSVIAGATASLVTDDPKERAEVVARIEAMPSAKRETVFATIAGADGSIRARMSIVAGAIERAVITGD